MDERESESGKSVLSVYLDDDEYFGMKREVALAKAMMLEIFSCAIHMKHEDD